MARWVCPGCGREFARRQSHTCVPGGTVDETFAGKPAWQREIFDAIMGHVAALGEVHLDAVSVGVFIKRERKMAEVRPKVRSVQMWLALERRASHRCLMRADGAEGRLWHSFKLTSVGDVDEGMRELLTEAFVVAGE